MTELFKAQTTQIMYVKPYESGSFYYPLPDYIGAINAILTNILTDQYGVNAMENGLSVDYIVKFVGNYSDEQKKVESQGFLNQHARAAKKKRPIIAFSPDKETMMEVENISGINEDKSYTRINENAQQEILSGHGVVSPMLVGIKTAGQLGGTDEIKEAKNLMFETVIQPGQHLLTKAFNRIMQVNGLEDLEIEKLTMEQTNSEITDEPVTPVSGEKINN
jgi:capsid portal protein